MRRRAVLLGAAGAAVVAGGLPRPAIAQGIKEVKMVTSWSIELQPGWGESADRLAQSITAMSDNRLKVTVYPANTLVRAFEVFDAVSAGAVDMYHSADNYFGSKSPALDLFSAVPYGMTADELNSWIAFGDGQALYDEVDAPFNIKPLFCMNTDVQMGGWFAKEVNTRGLQRLALSHAGPWRRGLTPHGCHSRDHPGWRDHDGTQIRRDRRQ
jgi:TRAP-type mannitol/chloroaromatic compound transport system substrate-binding protein